jgi:tetratricopeptide (TPR) repeat protein
MEHDIGEALAKAGEDAKALEAFNMAREIAPSDRVALLAVATATFNAGKFEQAKSLFSDLLLRFGRDLERSDRSAALYRLGIASSKLGDGNAAVRSLTEASDIDPNDTQVLDALADAYAQQGKWEEVAKIKRKRIDAAPDSDRFDLFVDLGEFFATKVNDKTRAAKAYLSALEIRPDDRRLLTRLMQLYSEERDWSRLVEIILRLADLVEDRVQLSKYYLTAAQLCHEQLNRADEAIDYYQLTLENDPANARALEGLAKLRSDKKDWAGLEQSYKKVLAKLPEGTPKASIAKLHVLLGDLYSSHLASPAEAINSYEKAQELDSSNDLSDKLGALYLKDSKQHWEKAVRSQRALLVKNPQHAETYKALRKLYTEAKKADEAWCFCQALTALKAAEPEEENFFKKFRADGPAVAAEKLNDELWTREVQHPQQDVLLTAIFACIFPAVLTARAEKRDAYAVGDADLLDPATDPGQMPRMLHYAAGVFGMKSPKIYAKASDDSGINFMHTNPPALFLGKAALAGGPAQPLAFLAGNRLAYFRPGHYIRQIVPTGTGLRSWLFAAIRAVNPAFPVTPDLQGSVTENVSALKAHLAGPSVELLTSLVTKLINSAASLDLKRWTIGVDLTADRAGLLLANDLPRALAVVRATPDDASPVPQKDRIRELMTFATSDSYFHLRQRLGIAIRTNG